MIMNNPRMNADDLVFQTWTAWPHRMLPETDPGAWTYTVKFAVTQGCGRFSAR